MTALELAMEIGAEAIELDVRRSGDGVLIVIHDESIDRTTDRSGAVAELSMAEIRLANLGAASDPEIPRLPRHESVPTLRSVFERFPGVEITVDVKDPEAADDVAALIREFDRVESTILYIEDGIGSDAFRSYPGRRATSTRQVLRLAVDCGWMRRAKRREVPEVVHAPLRRLGMRMVTQGLVRRVHESGRSIQVWTVNDTEEARQLSDWNVDGVITDDVRGLRAALASAGGGA